MIGTIERDALLASIKDGTVTVVDALGGDHYERQHLPGAVPLTVKEADRFAEQLLPEKDAFIVTYCTNVNCPDSGFLANRLFALGYSNVSRYHAGIQDWVEAGLPVESGPHS